jgi:DNA repair protein RadA/Sms
MRLGIQASELYLLSETHADSICQMVCQACSNGDDNINTMQHDQDRLQQRPPSLLVIDSIQTIICNAGGASAAGGITQVRECVALFLRLAKSLKVPIVLVGHVTKSGGVAGPRTVEHMVDCVLYLEGSAHGGGAMGNIRVLRASKNRFGSSDEIGVYEMTRGRLLPVSDPSSLFLAHRESQEDMDGSATAIALEGRRGKEKT